MRRSLNFRSLAITALRFAARPAVLFVAFGFACMGLPQTSNAAVDLPTEQHAGLPIIFDRLPGDPGLVNIAAGQVEGPIAFADAVDAADTGWHWEIEFGTAADSGLSANTGILFATPKGAWTAVIPPELPPGLTFPEVEFIFAEVPEAANLEFTFVNDLATPIEYDTAITEGGLPPDLPPGGFPVDYDSVDALLSDYPDFQGLISSFGDNDVQIIVTQITNPLPAGARIFVPEPSGCAMLVVALLPFLRRLRR